MYLRSWSLELEDDLHGPSVESADAGWEAHEQEAVTDPLRAGLGLLVRDDDALSLRVLVLHIVSEFVVASDKVKGVGEVWSKRKENYIVEKRYKFSKKRDWSITEKDIN